MNVALYVRVSSEKQAEKDLSIPAQLKALREYAKRNEHVIVREFVDEAESARTSNRPAFQEMISLSRLKPLPFQAILVWKFSRFARNREDSILSKSYLRKRGIVVISINERIDDTPIGKFMEGAIELVDEFYSENLAQDVIRGMREVASKGYFCGGTVPYGYKAVKVMDAQASRTKLEPDDYTEPIVKHIFADCLRGKGCLEIARSLNKDGIPGPGNSKWSKGAVNRVLNSEAVAGTLVWGKRSKTNGGSPLRVENAWEPIISKGHFMKVQSIMELRSPKVTRPRTWSSDYLLSGLMKCAGCGSSMFGHAAKSGQFRYYRCGNAIRRGPESCPGRWLPKEKIEGFVVDRIRDYILIDDNIQDLLAMVTEEIDHLSEGKTIKRRSLDKQLRSLDLKLNRLYEVLESGALELSDLAPRIKHLVSRKAEVQQVQNEVEIVMSQKKFDNRDLGLIRDYVINLKKLLDSASIMDQKSLLKSFVKGIDVSEKEITVNYTIPMPVFPSTNDMTHDGIGVLAFESSGSPKAVCALNRMSDHSFFHAMMNQVVCFDMILVPG